MAMFMELFPASSARRCHQPTMLNDFSSPWGRCGQRRTCNRSGLDVSPFVLMPSLFDRMSMASPACDDLIEKRQRGSRCGGRRSPTCSRWTTTVDVYGFSPDEITVREVDGEVKIQAKNSEGDDNEEGVLQREFRRCIKLPTDVDPKSLRSVIMENGKLRLVAFRKRRPSQEMEAKSKENMKRAGSSTEIEIKTTKQIAKEIEKQNMDTTSASKEDDGDRVLEQGDNIAVRNSSEIAPLADINVDGFEPDDLKVRVVGNDVFIHGEQNSVEEDGMQVRRRFLRSFTLPSRVDAATVKSTLTEDGRLVIKAAPPAAIERATTSGDGDSKQVADTAEQAAPTAVDDTEQVGETTNIETTDGDDEKTMDVAKENA